MEDWIIDPRILNLSTSYHTTQTFPASIYWVLYINTSVVEV